MGKKIMIVGANFDDKGSQAKLFIVIDKLRQRYNDCEFFYAHNGEQFEDSYYRFSKILYTKKVQSQVLKANPLSNITKIFQKKDNTISTDATDIIPKMDLIIDVSDHALSAESSMADVEFYLDNIRLAKKYKIPIILMPQSFGPFNFNRDNMYILGDMKDLLFYPKAIYAREKFGYDEMMGYFGLDNIRRSTDMLLINEEIVLTNVLTRFYRPQVPEITEDNNVAVIPNAICFGKKYYEHSMDMYQKLFEALRNANKNVYIFAQALSDMETCKELYNSYANFGNLHLIDKEMDSIELNMIMKKFEVVISSRYLACVQAYKNFIPVLLLGTGVRYKELAELLGQENLFFDVLSEDCNNFDVLDALNGLLRDEDVAKTRIQTRMLNIQTKSCFDVFDEIKWKN
ncbi:MAG TPA: hypothetical protein DEO83_09130 [Lachnospiraceae bacterium]|nr:hypothetical protein [Lachnospiraceae bacterium]